MEITFILKDTIRDAPYYDDDREGLPYFNDIQLAFDNSSRVVYDGPTSIVEASGFTLPSTLAPYVEHVVIALEGWMPTHLATQGFYSFEDNGGMASAEVLRRPVEVALELAHPHGRAQYDVTVRSGTLAQALKAFSLLLSGELRPQVRWEGAA